MTGDEVDDVEGVRFDAEEGVYRVDVDAVGETPSLAVVTAMAAIRGVSPTDLDPLYGAVDPDRLDDFLAVESDTVDALTLEFTYNGHEVRARSDGMIEIEPEG